MVTIKWHGHACMELIDSSGKSIVIDPHDGGSLGLPRPRALADAVLITHEHFDHNAYQVVIKEGGKVYSMKDGVFNVLGHEVKGIRVYHDKFRGRRRGENVAYLLNIEGVRILHLGDIGHIPDENTLKLMSSADVLMVPTGGTFTISPSEAVELTELINPKAVIPMHYWVKGVNLPLAPLEEFLKLVKDEVVSLETNEWHLKEEELKSWEGRKVLVFNLPPQR